VGRLWSERREAPGDVVKQEINVLESASGCADA
jgi:hypothetical protein